jgi:hypothetical protein
VYYAEETATGRQTSLRTKEEGEALTLLNIKNEATRQPAMNLQIAQVYLQHADPTMAQRTWQNVMDAKRFVCPGCRSRDVIRCEAKVFYSELNFKSVELTAFSVSET